MVYEYFLDCYKYALCFLSFTKTCTCVLSLYDQMSFGYFS